MRSVKRRLAYGLTFVLLSGTLSLGFFFLSDYRRTLFLREKLGSIRNGSSVDELTVVLGQPDAIWMQDDGEAIWIYCSYLDWDGVRSRWQKQSFFEYWRSRLNIRKDERHDCVIEVWVRGGEVVATANSVSEDLIGHYPTLKF